MDAVIQIKICGLTRRRDVTTAVDLGVDALGFILTESPRQVSLECAARLVEDIPPFVSRVAVVMNPEQERLSEIVSSRLFSHIQFHGQENPTMLIDLPIKTIKTFSVETEADLREIDKYQGADYFLFDTRIRKARGGTGKTFDWTLIKKITGKKPFILAGGLGPENVLQAIRSCNPAAVDLNSRLESEPGKKDPARMRQAVLMVREAVRPGYAIPITAATGIHPGNAPYL